MSEKEKKKTFSRKILFLSSFQKNKKLNHIKEETSFAGIPGIETHNGPESFLDPTFTDLLDGTVCLDTLEQSELGAVGGECNHEELTDIDALGLTKTCTLPINPAKSERRSFSNLRSVAADHPDVLRHLNSPGIQRFQNAHSMSVSNDSGIDCNVLLSKKTSPEQFQAFTRREAERIRQEQNCNKSVLETLTEVSGESRASDDSNAEAEDTVTERIPDNNNDLVCETPADSLQAQIDKTKKEVDVLAELKAVLSEKLDAVENQPTSQGAMLHCPPGSTETDSLEAAPALSPFDDHNNTMKSDQTKPNHVETRHTEISLNQLTPIGDDLLDNHANKTDETKTEEVRKMLEDELRESQMNGLQIDVPHSVVSPIQMVSFQCVGQSQSTECYESLWYVGS